MRVRCWAGLVVLGGAVFFCQLQLRAQVKHDKDLATRSNQLLVSYATFKSYPSKDAATTYKNLSDDRRAVFDAIVRAMFLPIKDKKGTVGKRLIDYVREVRGIWGVRVNDSEGRHMFRLSMRFAPELRQVLLSSANLPKAAGGHVLLPMQQGGDDDPKFNNFRPLLREAGTTTFREASEPSLQLSLLNDDPQTGEADIDFDPMVVFCNCHCKPSNSDVGSRKPASKTDVHLAMFNADVPYFSTPLLTPWSKPTAHCQSTY